MTVVERSYRETNQRIRDSFWDRDDKWLRDWDDWPVDWPKPSELYRRFRAEANPRSSFLDWPSDWPRMDMVVPRFGSHLDRMDRNWRIDPFWRDIYPRWAEPIFKEGIDLKTRITNDSNRFSVDVDAYQFKPEEIQVKTLDDTLLIEGRHEDVRDSDNFTKMYFVRKYQLPSDVDPADVTSSIDSTGRLTVEAKKRYALESGRERVIPIESASRRGETVHSTSSNINTSAQSQQQYVTNQSQQYASNVSSQQTQQQTQQQQQQEQTRHTTIRTGTSPRPKDDFPSGGQQITQTHTPQSSYSQTSTYSYQRTTTSGGERQIPVETVRSVPETIVRDNVGQSQMRDGSSKYHSESKTEYVSESKQTGGSSTQYQSSSETSSTQHMNGTGTKTKIIPITTTTTVDSGRVSTPSGGDSTRSESRSGSSVRSVQILRHPFGLALPVSVTFARVYIGKPVRNTSTCYTDFN
ncbi:hypothetical protein AB6A40_002310 [Gnathostoma spinigerum]|uniref:SHSP domain-containing protein n=1 Tax=Gnathostoma spinigerum TaxID=75299 RepID=A0ABD6E8T0_9BILA